MENKKLFVFVFFAVALFFSFIYVSFVSASDTMIMEVDVLADDVISDVISIEVPDKLDFGEVQGGQASAEFKVYINNTGTVDITVTPKLTDESEDIFSYLYFRKTKTKTINGTSEDVAFTKIGDFSFNITKPISGNDYNDEYFYTIIDLRNYPNEINSDMMDHRANVKFYAVAR